MRKFWVKEDLLLCIGAYIEAALYANAEITVHSTNDSNRYRDFLGEIFLSLFLLYDSCDQLNSLSISAYFKKRNYTDEQTIIVCSKADEVFQIKKIFRSEGYSKITYCHERSDSEKIGKRMTM